MNLLCGTSLWEGSMTLLIFVAACVLAQANPASVDLQGLVIDEAGNPVSGARVDITTAAPRVGDGIFCPSCYRDCAKFTRADGAGRFTLRSLDPSLKFRLLVSSPGKKPVMTKLIDPLTDKAGITLKDFPKDVPAERLVQGVVVDDDGVPLEGALVEPAGGKTAEQRWFGRADVEPAICDSKGKFSLLLPEKYLAVDAEISADGYAGTLAKLLTPGEQMHHIVVPAGTRVVARVVHDGMGVSGVRIAVAQTNRSGGGLFIQAIERVSDDQGRLTFDCLPASEEYAIFTVLGAGPQSLVLTTKKFKARGNREDRDLGDLQLTKPLTLAGKVELPAGTTLPANSRLALGRNPAWDLVSIPIASDGSFTLAGVPPESYTVRLAIDGMLLDGARLPYQAMEVGTFGIRLKESVTDLRIPLLRATEDRP
jgi:hypothetical protein